MINGFKEIKLKFSYLSNLPTEQSLFNIIYDNPVSANQVSVYVRYFYLLLIFQLPYFRYFKLP